MELKRRGENRADIKQMKQKGCRQKDNRKKSQDGSKSEWKNLGEKEGGGGTKKKKARSLHSNDKKGGDISRQRM